MYCKNCGNELPEDSNFCENCGEKQKILKTQTITNAHNTIKSRWNIYKITIGQFITLIIFGCILLLCLLSNFYYDESLYGIACIVLVFILIFYSIGWFHHRRNR